MKLLTWKNLLCASFVFIGNGSFLVAQEQPLPRTALEVLSGSASIERPTVPLKGPENPVHHAVLNHDLQTGQGNSDRLELTAFADLGPSVSGSNETPVPGILSGTSPVAAAVLPPVNRNVQPLLPITKNNGVHRVDSDVSDSVSGISGPGVPSILAGMSFDFSAVDSQPSDTLPPDLQNTLNTGRNPAKALPQVTLMELKPMTVRQPADLPTSSPETISDGMGRWPGVRSPELFLQPIHPGTDSPNGLTEPLELFEIERITASNQLGTDGKFSVSQMTGPLLDAGSLMEHLNLQNPYRNLATLETANIRSTVEMDGYANFWLPTTYTWITPSFEYRPLYFEQPNLERYGTRPKQIMEPVVSATKFFGTVGVLPFRMMHLNPCTEISTLGQQRPGECADYIRRSNGHR